MSQIIYVSTRNPRGLTAAQYRALTPLERKAWNWRKIIRDARFHVNGPIGSADRMQAAALRDATSMN